MRQSLFACVLAACAPEVPDEPSFQQDVLPILAANCVRCHGYPALGGAPETFRLDVFADFAVVPGEPRAEPLCGGDPGDPAAELVLCGAPAFAVQSALRLRDELRPMPPRFGLADHQREILERWAQSPVRGTPRPANRIPQVVAEVIARDGQTITLGVQTDDLDRDLVVGTLRLRASGASPLIGPIRSGFVELSFDTSGIPAGDHALVAEVDDGAEVHELPLGMLAVEGP